MVNLARIDTRRIALNVTEEDITNLDLIIEKNNLKCRKVILERILQEGLHDFIKSFEGWE